MNTFLITLIIAIINITLCIRLFRKIKKREYKPLIVKGMYRIADLPDNVGDIIGKKM